MGYSVANLIATLVGMSHWTDMGVPQGCLWFNVGLFVVIGGVNFLSVDGIPKVNRAPLGKPLYWGFIGVIVLFTFYMFGMAFFAEALLKGYGIEFAGVPKKFFVGILQYS